MPSQEQVINLILLQNIERLIPIQSNSDRRIIHINNNTVFVISSQYLHIFDVDGTLIGRTILQ